MYKKIVSVLLCVVMLTGCGSVSEVVKQEDVSETLSDMKVGDIASKVNELVEEEVEKHRTDFNQPMSVTDPDKYAELYDKYSKVMKEYSESEYGTKEQRDLLWEMRDLESELYGDVAGTLIGSDISLEEYSGTMMEYQYATSGKFYEDILRYDEFPQTYKDGDLIELCGIQFKVVGVYKEDKFDIDRVTSYQLQMVNNYDNKVDINIRECINNREAGFKFNDTNYYLKWIKDTEDVETNLDNMYDCSYSISAENLDKLGLSVPTIYRRISVSNYLEAHDLFYGDNWYIGNLKLKRNENNFYSVDNDVLTIDNITTGNVTITLDSDERYLNHAVVTLSWIDEFGNELEYTFHSDVHSNCYKVYSYPQYMKFIYGD